MIDLIENILLIAFEVICCDIFYETFGERRYKSFVNIIQLGLLAFMACLLSFILAEHLILKQIALIIVISIIMTWHINIGIKKSFALGILYDGLLLLTDYLVFSINSSLFSSNSTIEAHHMTEGILAVLLGKVVLFVCILVLRKQFGKKSTEMLVDTEWLRFLFFPVFTIVVIWAMISIFGNLQSKKQSDVLFIIAFGMVGMNIVVFNLINDIIERETQIHEDKIFRIQVKNQVEMYQSVSENFDKQKRKTHEYKNQILCIESLLLKKQYEELERYVKNIYGDLNKELDAINTNNVIVNAILNAKYQEAAEKGIVFVFKVNDLSDLCISDEDIVIIISNLLNNAIEACEKCDSKRIIKLKFVKEDTTVIIAVKNTFSQQIFYENGSIKTSKLSEIEEHGVGIKNVIRVIEKYNGSYIIQDKNSEFYFSIVIPSKKKYSNI